MAVPALGNCEFVVSEKAFNDNNRTVATSGKLDHSVRTEMQEAVNRQLLKEIFKSRATETSQLPRTGGSAR